MPYLFFFLSILSRSFKKYALLSEGGNIGAVDSGPSLNREGWGVRKRESLRDSLLCRQLFSLIILVFHLSMFFFHCQRPTFACPYFQQGWSGAVPGQLHTGTRGAGLHTRSSTCEGWHSVGIGEPPCRLTAWAPGCHPLSLTAPSLPASRLKILRTWPIPHLPFICPTNIGLYLCPGSADLGTSLSH